MEDVCVITGDIKKSRKLENRSEVQKRLKSGLSEINLKYKEELLSDFMITLGDEFQGVLKSPEKCYSVFLDIQDSLHLNIYFGIGIGDIETEIYEKTIEMDGSAFYRSREALKEAKKKKSSLILKSGSDYFDEIVNTIFNLITIIRDKWTKRQKEIVEFYKSGELTYEDVAQHFRVTKQSVSQVLKTANFEAIQKAENCLGTILRDDVKRIYLTRQSKS